MSENQREMQFVAWQNSSLQLLNMQQIRYYIRYIYIYQNRFFLFFFNESRGLKSGHSFTSASKLISLLLHFRDATKSESLTSHFLSNSELKKKQRSFSTELKSQKWIHQSFQVSPFIVLYFCICTITCPCRKIMFCITEAQSLSITLVPTEPLPFLNLCPFHSKKQINMQCHASLLFIGNEIKQKITRPHSR